MNMLSLNLPQPIPNPQRTTPESHPSSASLGIVIVIPVYNHPATLRRVVSQALQVHDEVMVVDDGSTDDTASFLQDLNVHLIRHRQNLGKGTAILTAAQEARRLGMTHIVTIDADGQHNPEDFKRFLPLIKGSPDAIIVGKRDFKNADVPNANRFGRGFSNFWLRLQTGKALGDVQSGFRVYPLSVLENLKLHEKRYTFEIEVLVKAAWAGVELLETDISVYYPQAKERVTHFHLFLDNVRLSRLNAKLTMRSILPWPHKKIVNSRKRAGEKITALHPLKSLKTLLTENSSPVQLASAGALGVFLGTLPLIACHTVAILFAAGFLRLNKIAAVSSSQLCVPPLVPALCIETGYFVRHGTFLTEISLKTLGYQAPERLYEWLIGSLILAPAMAVLIGGTIYIMAFFVSLRRPRK